MCGIVGIVKLREGPAPSLETLTSMGAAIHHRGPDHLGLFRDSHAAIGCARLAILDLHHGQQPFRNEDGTVRAVFNGEIFNWRELRAELESNGHQFTSQTDGELLVHLYEECGTALLDRLDGQFALAVWDRAKRRLLLARDRFGICPLHVAIAGDELSFASEIKALLCHPRVERRLDVRGIDEAFTFWGPSTARTAFEGVSTLTPGERLTIEDGRQHRERWWSFPPPRAIEPVRDDARANATELRRRLEESIRRRLDADVRVGTYLSGGLDSSVVTLVAAALSPTPIDVFSIAFDDELCDESPYQNLVLDEIDARHHVLRVDRDAILGAFPDAVWHAEAPLVRTAAAPLYLLSRAAHDHGVRVVLTGEGADEVLLGYDLYKAASIWERFGRDGRATPIDDCSRALLTDPYYDPRRVREATSEPIAEYQRRSRACHPVFGVHGVRWARGRELRELFTLDVQRELADHDPLAELARQLPSDHATRGALAHAQLLDVHTLLGGYLLAAQGDRMSMAHSVESRPPFLDHHLVEFLAGIPCEPGVGIGGEKQILKHAFEDILPAAIRSRRKQAYTAPATSLFESPRAPWIREAISEERLRATGIFSETAVNRLVREIEEKRFEDSNYVSAAVAVLSVQVLHERFVSRFQPCLPSLAARVDREDALADRSTASKRKRK